MASINRCQIILIEELEKDLDFHISHLVATLLGNSGSCSSHVPEGCLAGKSLVGVAIYDESFLNVELQKCQVQKTKSTQEDSIKLIYKTLHPGIFSAKNWHLITVELDKGQWYSRGIRFSSLVGRNFRLIPLFTPAPDSAIPSPKRDPLSCNAR